MRKPRYALYKGDRLLGIGTAKELAEARGCSPRTIMWYACPVNQRRIEGHPNRLTALRVE